MSKIINVYKQKNFNNYINDLKLEYILEKLKTDTTFLNKDVKELANISGFNNAEGFSDNFKSSDMDFQILISHEYYDNPEIIKGIINDMTKMSYVLLNDIRIELCTPFEI